MQDAEISFLISFFLGKYLQILIFADYWSFCNKSCPDCVGSERFSLFFILNPSLCNYYIFDMRLYQLLGTSWPIDLSSQPDLLSLFLIQVSQYTFAMSSYREKKAEPVELLQLDGYTVDYTDPQPGQRNYGFGLHYFASVWKQGSALLWFAGL